MKISYFLFAETKKSFRNLNFEIRFRIQFSIQKPYEKSIAHKNFPINKLEKHKIAIDCKYISNEWLRSVRRTAQQNCENRKKINKKVDQFDQMGWRIVVYVYLQNSRRKTSVPANSVIFFSRNDFQINLRQMNARHRFQIKTKALKENRDFNTQILEEKKKYGD